MYSICNELSNTSKKCNEFYLIIKRSIRNTLLVFDEDILQNDEKPKQKITVMKRKFVDNKQTSVIVQWKSAADVIKKLNFENKCLFGPVQLSNTNPNPYPYKDKLIQSKEIIQHVTTIPIFEPSVNHNDQRQNNAHLDMKQKHELSSILTFPLLNNFSYSTCRINGLNSLRKQLEFLCGNSKVPSVTMILQKTMSKERVAILDRWKQNMISQLGVEGFERYQAELFANGTSLHHSISSFLSSTPESELHIKEENTGHWKSLNHIFPNIKDVKLLEEFVSHPFLCYKGVVDCFAKYKNHLVVIDWKSSKKIKAFIKDTYDDPLQIAAYVGALNFDPKFQYLASKGLIVIAYENGHPASAHFIDNVSMKHYWNEWLKRVKLFWEMKNSEIENL